MSYSLRSFVMSSFATNTQCAPSRAVQGLLCVEAGMLFFVLQDAMMKSLLDVYPIWALLFVRSVVSVLILTPLIAVLGGPHRLLTPLWPLHLARAALFTTGFSLFYAAFPFMGLAEVTTIFFSAPLITALMAALWLGESIGPHRSAALACGFAGVVIAMNPVGETFSWVAVLPLICAVMYAASQVLARRIGDRESSLTVGLYTLAFSGVLILPMGWIVNQLIDVGPEFRHLRWAFPEGIVSDPGPLVLLGGVGMVGYILLGRAYQVANASLIAPFDYSYLPFATVLAYVMWHEVPPAATLAGMGLIVASGLYLGFRELRAARRAREQPLVAEAVYAPGSPVAGQFAEEETAAHRAL